MVEVIKRKRCIGFYVTSNIKRIGPKEDVLAFFWLVIHFVVEEYPKTDWSLITERFYKRYLRWEELAPAAKLMEQIQGIFAEISTDMIIWHNLGIDNDHTQLKLQEENLAGVFERFFKGFKDFYGYALLWKKEDDTYIQPLRIVFSDFPEFMEDDLRPLADYDSLEGDSFWLR